MREPYPFPADGKAEPLALNLRVPVELRLIISALSVSLALFFLAAILALPHVAPLSLGEIYAELSLNPFGPNPGNTARLRPLLPVISWLIRLRGDQIVLVTLVFGWATLFGVVYATLKSCRSLLEAALIGALFAFTIPMQFTLTFGGYPDSLMYFLILLMLGAGRSRLYWAFFALALLAHESIIFLLPFLVVYRCRVIEHNWREAGKELLFALPLALALWLAYTAYVAAFPDPAAGKQLGSLSYYLSPMVADPLYWLRQANLLGPLVFWGVYGAFRLVWIIPAIAAWKHVRNRSWLRVAEFPLIIAGTFAQLFLAVDTTRLLGLAFPMIVLSSWDLLKDRRGLAVVCLAVGGTLLSPPLYAVNRALCYFSGLWPGQGFLEGKAGTFKPTLRVLHDLSISAGAKVALLASLLTGIIVIILLLGKVPILRPGPSPSTSDPAAD